MKKQKERRSILTSTKRSWTTPHTQEVMTDFWAMLAWIKAMRKQQQDDVRKKRSMSIKENLLWWHWWHSSKSCLGVEEQRPRFGCASLGSSPWKEEEEKKDEERWWKERDRGRKEKVKQEDVAREGFLQEVLNVFWFSLPDFEITTDQSAVRRLLVVDGNMSLQMQVWDLPLPALGRTIDRNQDSVLAYERDEYRIASMCVSVCVCVWGREEASNLADRRSNHLSSCQWWSSQKQVWSRAPFYRHFEGLQAPKSPSYSS